jgi:hypothetical protein
VGLLGLFRYDVVVVVVVAASKRLFALTVTTLEEVL